MIKRKRYVPVKLQFVVLIVMEKKLLNLVEGILQKREKNGDILFCFFVLASSDFEK